MDMAWIMAFLGWIICYLPIYDSRSSMVSRWIFMVFMDGSRMDGHDEGDISSTMFLTFIVYTPSNAWISSHMIELLFHQTYQYRVLCRRPRCSLPSSLTAMSHLTKWCKTSIRQVASPAKLLLLSNHPQTTLLHQALNQNKFLTKTSSQLRVHRHTETPASPSRIEPHSSLTNLRLIKIGQLAYCISCLKISTSLHVHT